MTDLSSIFQQVANWNHKRYDRAYNSSLLADLLDEEYEEYFESNELVKKADALADIMYVAMGGLWKLNIDEEIIEDSFIFNREFIPIVVSSSEIPPVALVKTYVDCIRKQMYTDNVSLTGIINACIYEFQILGIDFEGALACLKAVADSNDTKSIKKTDSDKKANDGDKGEYYVPPTTQLIKILEGYNTNDNSN